LGSINALFRHYQRPPLGTLREPVLIQNASAQITDNVLEAFELAKFRDTPVDKVIYLDNRMLPDWISYEVWAVPPFLHGFVPLHTDWPAQIHLVTHTIPWVEVIIYEQGKRQGRR